MSGPEILLTRGTYDVLRRVPPDWMELHYVVSEIASTIAEPERVVRARVARLRELALVEQRVATTIDGRREVRRVVGWEES